MSVDLMSYTPGQEQVGSGLAHACQMTSIDKLGKSCDIGLLIGSPPILPRYSVASSHDEKVV